MLDFKAMDSNARTTPARLTDILQVNTSDLSGGAEKVSLGLHRYYLQRGLRSTLAVGWKRTLEPGVVEIPQLPFRSAWARMFGENRRAGLLGTAGRAAAEPLRYLSRLAGHEDFGFPGTLHVDELAPRAPQVLHLHNLHGGYFDIRALPELTARYPTIYSPHDPWALSGHCAHPMDCPRWRTGCDTCPDLQRYVPIARDSSGANWATKREALERSRFYLASPSRWMLDMFLDARLESSIIDARVIRNGIDSAVFSPGDRGSERRTLGIAEDATVIVTSARAGVAGDFKGADILEDAFEIASQSGIDRQGIIVLTLGDTAPPRRVGCFRIESVPYTADPTRVASYLRSADLYVHPSRAENYSLSILEALACGTPVVASDTGGTPEVVEDRRAALLFPSEDSAALAQVLVWLLQADHRLDDLAEKARDDAARCYTLEQQAEAYLDWYGQIIGA